MATESVETDALINIRMCPVSKNNAGANHIDSRKVSQTALSVKPTRSRSLEPTNTLSRKQNQHGREDSKIVLCRDQAGTRATGLRKRPCFFKASSCRGLLEKPKSILKPASAFVKSNSLRSLGVNSTCDKNEENGELSKLECKRKVKHNVSFEEINRWGNGSSKELTSDSFLLADSDVEKEEEKKEVMRLPSELKLKQDIGIEQMDRWGNSCSENTGLLRFDLDEILTTDSDDESQANGKEKNGLCSKINKMKRSESRDMFDRWGNGSAESSDMELHSLRLDKDDVPTVSHTPTLSPAESKSDLNPDNAAEELHCSSFDSLPRLPNRKRSEVIKTDYSEEDSPRFSTRKARVSACTNEFPKRKA